MSNHHSSHEVPETEDEKIDQIGPCSFEPCDVCEMYHTNVRGHSGSQRCQASRYQIQHLPRHIQCNPQVEQHVYLPYNANMIYNHLKMTPEWWPSPTPTMFSRAMRRLLKDLNDIWLREKQLLSGKCCNVTAVLICFRKLYELEVKAEEKVKKYRSQSEYWPMFMESVDYDKSQLIESVDFSRHPSDIGIYMRHVAFIDSKYERYIRREGDVVHLFARRRMRWLERGGGKAFTQWYEIYKRRLHKIVNKCVSTIPGIPVARTVEQMWTLEELFERRFKHVVAGWVSQMDKILLCPYCHFVRLLK